MKSITLVIPVFNEGAALTKHLPVIIDTINTIKNFNFKIVMVDDGSTDDTVSYLNQFANQVPIFSFLCLNRNFGKEAAIHAGLKYAVSFSNAVIIMDSDLQHPPALIPQMIHLWQQGIQVVEGYKVSRGKESLLSQAMAQSFYYLFKTVAGMDIKNHADFKLLDHTVVDAYCALPERQRFFRGMIHWMGFSTAQIPFEVPAREHGASVWSRFRLMKLALTAITSFSAAPLQLVTFFGIFFLIMSFILGTIAVYHKFAGIAVSGFTTVILLLLLIGSLLMVALGLIGVYLAQIYEEVKQRPTYLVNWDKSHINQKES